MLSIKRLPLTVDEHRVAGICALRRNPCLWVHAVESADQQFWRCLVEHASRAEAAAALAGMGNQVLTLGEIRSA
jgi:hypothetical protein